MNDKKTNISFLGSNHKEVVKIIFKEKSVQKSHRNKSHYEK